MARAHAGFLDQLAFGRFERGLVGFELAGWQFPDPAIGDITILPEQTDPLPVIQGDDGRAAGMVNDIERGPVPVRENDFVGGDGDDAAAVVKSLLFRFHTASMRKFRLFIITGLPGTGKTTLARELARRQGVPLICKDTIKEPLLEVLAPARASRELSNIAFTVQFSLARELLALGNTLILEGNFRAGEHETSLRAVLPPDGPDIIQILCRADEDERRARILGRTQHAGHRTAHQLERADACDAFLDLPGERQIYRVGCGASCEIPSL